MYSTENSEKYNTDKYDPNFLRWYLKNTFQHFRHLNDDQLIIEGFSNRQSFDLTIDLKQAECRSKNDTHTIAEYVAERQDITLSDALLRIQIEQRQWYETIQNEQEDADFIRDHEQLQWKMEKDDEWVPITTFDIVLNAIVEKFNRDEQEWERTYIGRLVAQNGENYVNKSFRFEPSQIHSVKQFSESVWKKDFFQIKNMRNEDVRRFWAHLDEYHYPPIIREYDHYGFIEAQGEPFFLAGNVLIRFPDESDGQLQLISKTNNGAFKIDDNQYVRPPSEAVHLPVFELGVSDYKTKKYKDAMEALLEPSQFEQELKKVEDHLCGMIGEESEFREWGKLILGYVFSYLFFDEIYDLFKHGIFLYLYGQGNVGKGELVKRILDCYGISYLDSLNTPPARSVDEALEQKSKIPAWIDEHVPEVPGKKAKIEDQVWNSWFEKKPRPTNIKKGNKWGKERKKVRTMPIFCSNYRPRTDHLSSRCLILEYKKSRRGPEQHVRWLKQHKDLMQLLMLSYMQQYKLLDREVFSWNLDRVRTLLRDQVKQELEHRVEEVILQDRQISQFAALIVVYHWLFTDYRQAIEEIAAKNRNLSEKDDVAFENYQKGQIKSQILDLMDKKLYAFVKDQIVKSAAKASRFNPLTEYIETIGSLVQDGKITQEHFRWMKNGTLKIHARGVWDKYVAEKRGTDDMVRKQKVEHKLKEHSQLAKNGELKVVTWTIPDTALQNRGEKIQQRGYYIPDAVHLDLFRRAFNWRKYKPGGAKPYEEMRNDTVQTDDVDDVPF